MRIVAETGRIAADERDLLHTALVAYDHETSLQGRLDDLEAARRRLLADQSHFDDREGGATVGRFTKKASKSPAWCRFLHTFTRGLAPSTAVEMGTGVGISAAAIASGMPPGGRVWTVDLRPESGEQARRLLHSLGLAVTVVTGRFAAVLDDVLAEAAPVELLFVDGHHEHDATLRYTEQAAPRLAPGAVVVYDDIRWSEGMQRAWETLRSQDRWAWTADLGELGVCRLPR